jgi:hypothetical protein
MALTSTQVVNRAIFIMGDNQQPVTGVAPNFDSSTAGVAAAQLYAGAVATVARQFEWDFTRQTLALVLSGNPAPFPWAFEYLYPAQCVEIWQVAPSALADANNPMPVNWNVAYNTVGGNPTKVVQTNQANALAIFNANPPEAVWDSIFTEAVVRLLASEMAMAIAGKPDFAAAALESGAAFESIGEARKG